MAQLPPMAEDWANHLAPFFASSAYHTLCENLAQEPEELYPPNDQIFSAFHLTPYQSVQVVVLGQDPYHGAGQANGLAFSVAPGVKIPPSLRNIYQEVAQSCGGDPPTQGDLTPWAKQGVLLLNTCLTVRPGQANSHQKIGWEPFTQAVLTLLNQKEAPLVFLLWGGNAMARKKWITNPHHLVLTAVHPSPLSAYRGFLGCNHFVQANQFLQQHQRPPIQWTASSARDFS